MHDMLRPFTTGFMDFSIFLTHIYLRHAYELRAFLHRRVGCREVAAELTQEAFIRFMGYQTGDTVHNVRAMLYRIAGNLATDYHRVQMKRHVQTDIDALPQHELPISDASDPARIVYARQTLEALCHVIEALPPQCYRAFVLHKVDGLSDISRKDAESVTAWRKNRLIFRDTPLDEVVRQINRYHSRPVRLGEPRLGKLKVSGEFNATDRNGLIRALTTLFPLRGNELDDMTVLYAEK